MAEHAVPFAPQPQQLATSKQVCLRGSTARLYFMKGEKIMTTMQPPIFVVLFNLFWTYETPVYFFKCHENFLFSKKTLKDLCFWRSNI